MKQISMKCGTLQQNINKSVNGWNNSHLHNAKKIEGNDTHF